MFIEEQIQEILKRLDELEKEKQKPAEEWLTIAECARRLGVSYSVISDRVQDGRIRSTRMAGHPRIPMSQFSQDAAKVEITPIFEEKPKRQSKRTPAGQEPEWAEAVRKAVFG